MDRTGTVLDRLEKAHRRWLAVFDLTPGDPRRFVVDQVILYVELMVIVGMIMFGKLTAEPGTRPVSPPLRDPARWADALPAW